MFPRWIGPLARSVAGVFAALVALEIALRAIATPGLAPLPDVGRDALDAPPVARRQIEEGVASSHYSIYGARLTGNPALGSGTNAVVMGDSYVAAEQVADGNTMGARLEDFARQGGVPLDVRQYGWTGASPAQYIYAAREVLGRWKPQRVFVVVASNDFDRSALLFADPRFRVGPGDSLRIIGAPMPLSDTAAPRGSVLIKLVRHRWQVVGGRMARRAAAERGGAATPHAIVGETPAEAPPDSAEYARAPVAVVRALSAAYGSRLTVVYIADVGVRPDTVPEPAEAGTLAACKQLSVDCVSTRDAMIDALAKGQVSHGAGINPLGNGHLSPAGHEALGRVMWQHMARASALAASRGAR
jgi:hypothetical protein